MAMLNDLFISFIIYNCNCDFNFILILIFSLIIICRCFIISSFIFFISLLNFLF